MDGSARSLRSDPGEGGAAIPENSLADVIEKSWHGPQFGAGFSSEPRDADGTGRMAFTPQRVHDTADSMARCPSSPRQRTDESTNPAPIAKYVNRRKNAIFRENSAFFRFEFRIRMVSPKTGSS
jgi:hypothetical protein